MANGAGNPSLQNDEFKKQTPGAYKWAMGAGGLVAAATTASLAFKPETAGYSLSGLVLFTLLIFIVISLEVGTSKPDESNPLAKNAQLQVKVLSWFATVALIMGAAAIMSSILFRWPQDMALNEDKTTNKYLASIKGYDLQSSFFERRPDEAGAWEEKSRRDKTVQHSFTEDYLDPHFLLLSDTERNVKLRIPTQGGMLEWSLNEKFNNCQDEYCWGDVTYATMRR
jgi:hypothetical protein